jgi:RNA polymerase sigma-70 factor (ECF subfamily)
MQVFGMSMAEEASADPAGALDARLDGAAALRAMEDLSPMQRACLELVVLRGLSIQEVAAMHGISESTVRQHVFRARASLRTMLGDQQRGDRDA